MKRLLFIAVVALMQRTGPESATTSAIDGVVKHSGTADFISSVVVSLIPQTGMPMTSTTDDKGHFAFKNVAAGSYRLQPQRDGYLRAPKGSGPQTLTVVAGKDLHDVELSLIAAGSISGRIVDNMGQPLKGIQMSAVMVGYNNGRESPITAIGADPRPLTDDRGEYRLYGFSPGDYFVKAETPPSVSAAATSKMVSFYPGTLSAPTAVPVTLREGTELSGINFKLQAPDTRPLHKISGKVILPEQTAGSGIVGSFYLFPRDREAGADGNGYTILSTNRAESMSNGNFVLRDVPPGQYDVIATLPALSTQREYSRVEVVVGDKDVDGVTIPLSRKFDVKGRVVDSAGGSLAPASLRISLTPDFQLSGYSASVDANGTFDFKDVAEGKYSVSVAAGLPSSAYVADIRQNSKSIFAGVTSPDDAVIEVNSEASSAPSIEVVVNPAGGVAPGNYKVFAWERTPLRAYQSADFLREYETQGKFVHVDDGGRVDATVSVIPDDGNRPPRTFKNGTLFTPAPVDATPQAPSPTTSNPNNATVEGKVTRLKTGDPISGVPVYVGDQVARSGPDGHYIINNVPPGTYSLSMLNARQAGYFAPGKGGVPGNVTVKAGQHVADLDFRLVSGGIVSGRVMDSNGQPVAGAIMDLEGPDYQYGQHYLLPALIVARTDNRGDYRISGIEPGEYFLRARPPTPSAGAITYFPGTLDLAKTPALVVKEDGELTKMDITLQPASGNSIAGKIVSPVFGDSPASVSFYLVPRNGGMSDLLDMLTRATFNRDKGEFEIANILPGSYDLIASARSASANRPGLFDVPAAVFGGRTRVDVGSNDVTGLSMTLNSAVDVQGHVRFDGGAKIPFGSFRLYMAAEEFGPTAIWISAPATLDATGQFAIQKVQESKYSFQVEGLPEDAYISDIREGNTSIYDRGLTVGNSSPSPIEIVINPKGGTVEGVVQDIEKNGVAFARVVLVPQSSRRGNSMFYKTAITGKTGHFSFHAIAPGEYKLFSWENVPARAWQNVEFLAPYEDRGAAVQVAPAATAGNLVVNFIPAKTQE